MTGLLVSIKVFPKYKESASHIRVGSLAARAADCKSVTLETSVVRIHLDPLICGRGETGKRDRLKICWLTTIWVRVPSPA